MLAGFLLSHLSGLKSSFSTYLLELLKKGADDGE